VLVCCYVLCCVVLHCVVLCCGGVRCCGAQATDKEGCDGRALWAARLWIPFTKMGMTRNVICSVWRGQALRKDKLLAQVPARSSDVRFGSVLLEPGEDAERDPLWSARLRVEEEMAQALQLTQKKCVHL
jgi:hypothetical protein